MTQEQKARAYDEAIEKAKGLVDFCSDNELKTLEFVFSELKESESERIRKWLINLVKSYIEWLEDRIKEQLSNGQVYGEELNEAKDALAWLEKQCQVKDSAISQHENETCKENDNSLTSEDIRKGLIQYFNTFTLNTFAGIDPKKILSWLEKQGKNNMGISSTTKQKLKDSLNNVLAVETGESWNEFLDEQKSDVIIPKFKIGDIIEYVGERKELIDGKYEIQEIGNDFYVTTCGAIIPFKFEEYYIKKLKGE